MPLLLLALWQTASLAGALPERFLPAPTTVLQTALRLTASGELPRHLLTSLQRVAIGFAIGGGLGLMLGCLVGLSKLGDSLLDSSLQMLRTVPHLALIPFAILWFGVGETPKIFLVALGSLFPLYLNTVHGIRSVDPRLREMGAVYGLSTRESIAQIVVPGALPGILVGVRFGLGVAWLSLVVGETIAASSGLGYMAMDAREFARTDVVLLAVVIYALIGQFADSATRLCERRLLAWHPSYAAVAR
jgi:sulfonate transport system permease protein